MIFSNKVLYKGEILFTKYIPNNLIVKHNQENDEDFTRNVVANLVSESFSRYKK